MQGLNVTKPVPTVGIDRRSGLTQEEFVKEYRDPGKPVIFTDLSKSWSASTVFSLDFFQEQYGHKQLKVGARAYTVREVVDLLKHSTAENPAPYPIKFNLRDDFSELQQYVEPRPDLAMPDRTHHPLLSKRFISGLDDLEVFLGGPGGAFPYLHYDYLGLYAFINQIYGDKEFTVFPPDQQAYLYPKQNSLWVSEIQDHHNPDLTKYPLFAKATPITVVVSAGETLFIPCGWYHTARSLTLTISVAFDQLCRSNWEFFIQECLVEGNRGPIKSKLTRAYLTALGSLLSAQERLQWKTVGRKGSCQ